MIGRNIKVVLFGLCGALLFGCVTAPRSGESFRIVSYNIHHGEGTDEKLSVWRVGCAVLSENPRFAGIQEVDRKTERVKGADSCRTLEKVTGLHATYAKTIDLQGGEYGIAVLSREIPQTVKRVPLPGAEPRMLLLCEFDDCWFGTTHLAVESEKARTESVEIIRREVAACSGKPVFLTGDWNAKSDSTVLDGLREFLTVVSEEREPTCGESCIDYVAVDSAHRGEFAVRGRRVVPNEKASDHRPIVVEVEPVATREKSEEEFSLATFNVRCPCDPGELAWYRRMPRVAEVVRAHGIDVFGVQEATPSEVEILQAELLGFSFVGCGRDENRSGESMLIFYRNSRFECLESDTFWLSETPGKPGSKYTGAGCPRTCTWALLKDRMTGRKFRYFNTHLDHISSKARWDGMQVLLERGVRPAKARGETIFLTGDLNETLDEADSPQAIAELNGPKLLESAKENPIALVSTELTDTYALSETPHAGTFKTFHGFRGEPMCRIDYVFATPDVKVRTHATLNDKPDGQFASDHYPVAVTVSL